MNAMQLYLPFSPDGKTGVTVNISGERPLRIAGRAAKIINTELQQATGDGKLIFSDTLNSGDKIYSDPNSETEIFDLPEKSVIYQLPPDRYVRRNSRSTVKQIFSCAVRQSWKMGIKSALLHGAMLTCPEHPEKCILVFGISGMGKSTTAGRWKAAGGDFSADDMVLLYQNENGELFARPLPTWSRYPESVNFNHCCRVKAVLRLQRGEFDEVCPADPLSWSVDCAKALMFHHCLPVLRTDISAKIALECMKSGEILRQKFGTSDLNTNLNSNISPVLENIFKQ